MKRSNLVVSFITASVLFLTGCVSTTTNQPKKWEPEERAEAHVDLGMTYLRRNQLDTASLEFNIALSINPKSDTAYHAKALLLTRKGNHKEATTFFRKSVSLNPKNYQANNDFGIHLCQQNQMVEGIERLSRIDGVAENDQTLGTKLGLGICYFKDNQFDLAEKYLRTILEQSPRLPQALLPMAQMYYQRNQFLPARGFLERYFGTGSLSESSLYLASNVEFKLGDKIKADQYRRELRRRYPLSPLNKKLDSILE